MINDPSPYMPPAAPQTETPQELADRWRKRAATLESGDGASRFAAYQLRFAADELDAVIGRDG